MTAHPAGVLATILRSDPGRPRVTFYEDTPGVTRGERIELSAKVFANWVNKAANALQEEWELGPGSRIRLDLPPHWRALYWAVAVWSVGGSVVLGDHDHDLLVTDGAVAAEETQSPAVLVTLAALSRGAVEPVPPGVMDEARELATYADQFSPWDEPGPDDVALRDDDGQVSFEQVVPPVDWPAGVRAHTADPDLGSLLRHALAVWSLDGSLVLSRGPAPSAGYDARLAAEGVTLAL